MISSMSLSRSSDIDRFCASSHSKKAFKMNLFGKRAMRPNWLIHKLESSAMLHYPNSGIFWVVHHIHVDHMDRSFVFSFSLREVFQGLVINLNEISSELDEFSLLVITFSSTVSIMSNSSVHSWNLSGPAWKTRTMWTWKWMQLILPWSSYSFP